MPGTGAPTMSRQEALDGFLGAGYALHIVAAMRMLSEPGDIGRAVGDGNAEWFATVGPNGRGTLLNKEGEAVDPMGLQRFTPTLFLYDNYPGGIGISAPLFENRAAIVEDARALVGAGRKITVVFDRGGFSPRLFARLAKDFHIITYWKGKKLPPLPAHAFETHEIDVDGKTIQYRLHDAPRTKVGRIRSKDRPGPHFFWMRRVTRLREDGKQTHVLTTHTDLEPAWVLYRMFNRWRQENFFKYMREEFALDGLLEYGVDDITEGDRPNPKRQTLKKKLKKVAAKIADLLSALGAQAEDKEGSSHKTMQGFRHAHASLRRQLQAERKRAERLHKKIDALPKRVPADDLKTLKREVKLIGDAIKMTAYQVEGELYGLLSGIYPRQDDEGRTLLHAAFESAGQIQVDGDKLRITIEPQSSPHRTAVLAKLCENLNAEDTAFPGSQLRLRFAVEGDQPAKM